jgi:hypothetical protein
MATALQILLGVVANNYARSAGCILHGCVKNIQIL